MELCRGVGIDIDDFWSKLPWNRSGNGLCFNLSILYVDGLGLFVGDNNGVGNLHFGMV
jgi:hypothetical protein